MKKREKCSELGITLFIIPYWWNKTVESVARTIHAVRPDVHISPSMLNGDLIPERDPKTDKGRTLF